MSPDSLSAKGEKAMGVSFEKDLRRSIEDRELFCRVYRDFFNELPVYNDTDKNDGGIDCWINSFRVDEKCLYGPDYDFWWFETESYNKPGWLYGLERIDYLVTGRICEKHNHFVVFGGSMKQLVERVVSYNSPETYNRWETAKGKRVPYEYLRKFIVYDKRIRRAGSTS
jgi:hypothetical protein